MRKVALFVLACAAIGCHSRHDRAPVPPSSASAAPSSLTNVFVENVSPADLVQVLEHATHRVIDWDDDTLRIVACAKVSLKRDGLDAAALVDAVAGALRPVGLVLVPNDRGFVVHKAPDAPEPHCELPPQPEPPDTAAIARATRGIVRKSPTSFEVPDSVRQALATLETTLLREVRLVPDSVDGGIVGVRLFGVRTDSFFAALGVMNGDRLESVSGRKIENVAGLLQEFRSLRTAKSWSFGLVRRGVPLELHYALRSGR